MKTKILMFVALMSLSAVLMAQPTDGASKKPFRGPSKEMRMAHDQRGPANGLNLSAEQKEAFKQGMLATQKQLQPLRNELGELKAHQKTLMTAEKADLNAIDKNIEKMGALEVEMEQIQARQRLEMRAQLTEEQRLKFDFHKHGMMKHDGPKAMQKGKARP